MATGRFLNHSWAVLPALLKVTVPDAGGLLASLLPRFLASQATSEMP